MKEFEEIMRKRACPTWGRRFAARIMALCGELWRRRRFGTMSSPTPLLEHNP